MAAGLAGTLSVLALPGDSHAGNAKATTAQSRSWKGHKPGHTVPQQLVLSCDIEKEFDEGNVPGYPIVRLTNTTGATLPAGTRIYFKLSNGETAYYDLPTALAPGQKSMPIDVASVWAEGLGCTARIVSRKVWRGPIRRPGFGRIGGIRRVGPVGGGNRIGAIGGRPRAGPVGGRSRISRLR